MINDIQISGSLIYLNGAQNGGGVGVVADKKSPALTLADDTTIVGNIATEKGGGLYMVGEGKIITPSVLISGNVSNSGGGIYLTTDVVREMEDGATVRRNLPDNTVAEAP